MQVRQVEAGKHRARQVAKWRKEGERELEEEGRGRGRGGGRGRGRGRGEKKEERGVLFRKGHGGDASAYGK